MLAIIVMAVILAGVLFGLYLESRGNRKREFKREDAEVREEACWRDIFKQWKERNR